MFIILDAIVNFCYSQKNNLELNAETFLSSSDSFWSQKRYTESINFTIKSIHIADSCNQLDLKNKGQYKLSERYFYLAKFKESYTQLQQAHLLNDSLSKIKYTNSLAKIEDCFAKEKIKMQTDLETIGTKQKQLTEEKKKIEFNYLLIFSGILFLLFLTLLFSLVKNRNTKRIILKLKREAEKNQLIVENKNTQIQIKEKEILHSINYLQRIQSAHLNSALLLSKNSTEYFILHEPREIISGDFYWATEIRKLRPGKMFSEKGSIESKGINEKSDFIVVCGNCDGHRISGAILSLLTINKLNETINEKKINKPGLILDNLQKEISQTLSPINENDFKGIDCTLLRFDFETKTLHYSAANNSFYLLRNGKINICPADKITLGKYMPEGPAFASYSFGLEKGDLIYLFTENVRNQFEFNNLENILITNHQKSLEEQKNILKIAHSNLTGNSIDILIAGIRI